MSEDIVYSFLEKLIKNYSKTLADDLCGAPFQKTFTTKCARREKALAYMLEVISFELFSGNPPTYSDKDWVNEYLEAAQAIKSGCKSDEAKTALNRVEKKILWTISHGRSIGNKLCVACGEYYIGNDHKCTNEYSINKDKTMVQNRGGSIL